MGELARARRFASRWRAHIAAYALRGPTSRLSGAPALERCSAVAQDLRHSRSRPAKLAGDLVLVQPLGRKLEDELPFGVGPGACANVLELGSRPHDELEQLQSVDSGVLAENLERRRGAGLQIAIGPLRQGTFRD
jgi:hypothetical protein